MVHKNKELTAVYRIFNNELGLYSNGGNPPKWTAKGKIWTKAGYLRLHLMKLYGTYRWREFPVNWEIERCTISQVDRGSYEIIEEDVGEGANKL